MSTVENDRSLEKERERERKETNTGRRIRLVRALRLFDGCDVIMMTGVEREREREIDRERERPIPEERNRETCACA